MPEAAASMPRLSVVVPAYNEEERLPRTLARLAEYYGEAGYSYEVLVVSDGSKDATASLAEAFAVDRPEFRVIAYPDNRGKGYAVRLGMLQARGERVLFCDADLATPQEETSKLMDAMDRGAQVAIGSRPKKDSSLEIRQPLYRELLGRSFNKAVQMLAISGIDDTQCGFKLFTHDACQAVFSRCKLDGFSFDFEALMIARDLGYEIAEVPIRWRHQEGSKVNVVRDGLRMLRDLVKLRLRGKRARLALNPTL